MRSRQISSVLAIVALAIALPGCASHPSIVDRLREQVERYPEMQPDDVYKFVYQAANGNGHLITDESDDRKYLAQELASVQANSDEPLIEPVSPDGKIVRVNLRPFKASGGNIDKLADAMIESAKRIKPNRIALERWWSEVVEASTRRQLPFDPVALKAYGSLRQIQDYPAQHHSPVYAKRYFPAYRVVLKELFSNRAH